MMAIAFLGYFVAQYDLNKTIKTNKSFNKNIYLSKSKKIMNFNNQRRCFTSYSSSNIIFNESSNIIFNESQINNNDYSNIIKEFILNKNIKPVYIYENLQLETTKNKIKLETANLSGIYLILNKFNLDFYVGSASTNKFYARFSNHLINFNGSKIVKLAVRKYKLSQFAFLILEIFPEIVTKENNKKLLDIEDFYLKSLLPNYNILTEAGSSFGYKHTEISRIKMKSNYSEERRMRIGNLNKNKKFSQETIEKMRNKALNRDVINLSDDARNNMRKNSKKIILYNLDYTVYGEYPSIVEASKNLNCNEKTIRRALKTEKHILKRR